jgi:hypothetical protein
MSVAEIIGEFTAEARRARRNCFFLDEESPKIVE